MRRAVMVIVAVALITWISFRADAPIATRDWNARQIARIHASEPGESFSFAVMGDSRNSTYTFSRILEDIDAQRFLFAIDLGDLVNGGEKREYRYFLQTIENTRVPFLAAAGNHDIIDNGRDIYERVFGQPYYSFVVGRSLFVVLDDANEKSIDAQQMEWLRNRLAGDYAHKFVFMHVPPFDPREPTSRSGRDAQNARQPGHCLQSRDSAERFMRLMEAGGVDIVFASHIHGYFDETRNAVRYIVTGGAGAGLRGTDPARYFYHYVSVKINGNEMQTAAVRFESPDSNEFDRVANILWLYVRYFTTTSWRRILLAVILIALVVDVTRDRIRRKRAARSSGT